MKRTRKKQTLFDREMRKAGFRKAYEAERKSFELEIQILRALKQQNMTLAELARSAGMSLSNVSRDISRKKINRATLPRISKIANAIDSDFIPVLLPRKPLERKRVISRLEEAFG